MVRKIICFIILIMVVSSVSGCLITPDNSIATQTLKILKQEGITDCEILKDKNSLKEYNVKTLIWGTKEYENEKSLIKSYNKKNGGSLIGILDPIIIALSPTDIPGCINKCEKTAYENTKTFLHLMQYKIKTKKIKKSFKNYNEKEYKTKTIIRIYKKTKKSMFYQVSVLSFDKNIVICENYFSETSKHNKNRDIKTIVTQLRELNKNIIKNNNKGYKN